MNYKTITSHLFFIAALLSSAISFALDNHDIMSYEEYAKTKYSWPYTYKLVKPGQVLFYFGANHSCDPNNKQYPALEEFWNEFLTQTGGKDCVVLVEGSKRRLYQNKYDAITRAGGEGGLLNKCCTYYFNSRLLDRSFMLLRNSCIEDIPTS